MIYSKSPMVPIPAQSYNCWHQPATSLQVTGWIPVTVSCESGREFFMLRLALGFFIVALLAAVLGFSGIALAAAGIGKVLFFVFLLLFLVSLLGHVSRRT